MYIVGNSINLLNYQILKDTIRKFELKVFIPARSEHKCLKTKTVAYKGGPNTQCCS